MKRFEHCGRSLSVGVAILGHALAPTAAALASGGSEGGHQALSPLTFSFAASVINFAIFLFLLFRFGAGPIRKAFEGRARELQAKVDELSAEKRSLEAQMAEMEKRLAVFDSEKTAYIDGVRRAATAEADKVIADAHQVAEQMVRDAEKRAATLKEDAELEIMSTFVDSVIDAVEARLKSGIEAARDQSLISDTLKAVKVQ